MQFWLCRLLILLVIPSSTAPSHSQDRSYTVNCDRTATVGQCTEFTASGTQVLTTVWRIPTTQPATQPSVKSEFELRGKIKTVAVNAQSHMATKVDLTVELLTKDKTPIIPPGSVVEMENTGDTMVCTVEQKQVDPTISQALAMFISLDSPKSSLSLGALFKPQHPMKIGETWAADPKKLSDYFNSWKVYEDCHANCDMKLTGVEQDRTGTRLRIESKWQVDLLRGGLKNDSRINSCQYTGRQMMMMAEDLNDNLFESRQTSQYRFQMTHKTPDGKLLDYDFNCDNSINIRSEPLKTE